MAQVPSHGCCTIPPVIATGYEKKGEWSEADGLKTYATGPKDAKRGLFIIYDIFGYSDQILQGADILAHGDSDSPLRVFMPDFLKGKYAQKEWYANDTPENEEKKKAFFAGPAVPGESVERVPAVLEALKKSSGIESWAVMGYCWGGKVVNLTVSKETSLFKTAISVHPAFVDASDAPNVKVPFLMLPSMDESKDDVEKWQAAMKVKNEVVWFNEHHHGWMAARTDLSDKQQREGYERAYQTCLDWLHENL